MKINLFYIIILEAFVCALSSCYSVPHKSHNYPQHSNLQQDTKEFTTSKIETLEPTMLPDSGAYYIYKSSDYGEKVDPVRELSYLLKSGFEITTAWYRSSLGGCNQPGTSGSTKTMHSPFLLIRLSNTNERILNHNYNKIELNANVSFPCPYRITVFVPSNK